MVYGPDLQIRVQIRCLGSPRHLHTEQEPQVALQIPMFKNLWAKCG